MVICRHLQPQKMTTACWTDTDFLQGPLESMERFWKLKKYIFIALEIEKFLLWSWLYLLGNCRKFSCKNALIDNSFFWVHYVRMQLIVSNNYVVTGRGVGSGWTKWAIVYPVSAPGNINEMSFFHFGFAPKISNLFEKFFSILMNPDKKIKNEQNTDR